MKMGELKDLKRKLTYAEYEALMSIPEYDMISKKFDHYDSLQKNGNYWIMMFEDGTKLRFTDEEEFIPEWPECIDVTISNRCNMGCQFCYADCKPTGADVDILGLYNMFRGLPDGTEIAINVNDVNNRYLFDFIDSDSVSNLCINATINGQYLLGEAKRFQEIAGISVTEAANNIHNMVPSPVDWKDYAVLDFINRFFSHKIKGLGISWTSANDTEFKYLMDLFSGFPGLKSRIVFHTIAGVTDANVLDSLISRGFNVLILGYKAQGRGEEYISQHREIKSRIDYLQSYLIDKIGKHSCTSNIALDGLAIKQLNVKSWIGEDKYDKCYAGDEGEFTFYLDLVNGTYNISSISKLSSRRIPGSCSSEYIKQMFEDVRQWRLEQQVGAMINDGLSELADGETLNHRIGEVEACIMHLQKALDRLKEELKKGK